MTWNLPKIREACLELMGFRMSGHVPVTMAGTVICSNPNATTAEWIGPTGLVYSDDGYSGNEQLPDPTESLDDGTQLMEKYWIGLMVLIPTDRERRPFWAAWTSLTDQFGKVQSMDFDDTEELRPSLAVCLVALKCAGHNLKDYEQ